MASFVIKTDRNKKNWTHTASQFIFNAGIENMLGDAMPLAWQHKAAAEILIDIAKSPNKILVLALKNSEQCSSAVYY